MSARIKDGKSTYNRDLRDIKALFNWHYGRAAVVYNPANDIEKMGEDVPLRYVPSMSDYAAVKQVASPDEKDFLKTVLHAGLRRIEAIRLLWERDVNFETRSLIAWTKKRKNGALTPKPKPMTKTLCRVLEARYQNRDKSDPRVFQFDIECLDKMLKHLCKKAGVRTFSLHALRHLGASILLSENVPLTATQDYLGHERITTTNIYAHTFSSSLQRAVMVLDNFEELT